MGSLDGLHVLTIPSWFPSPEVPISGVFSVDYVKAFAAAGARVGVVFPDLVSLRTLGRGAAKPIVPREIWESLDAINVLRIRGLHTAMHRPAWQMGRFRRWLKSGLAAYRAKFGDPDLLHAVISIPAGWACTHLDDPLASRVMITEVTGPFSLVMSPNRAEPFVRTAIERAAKVVTSSEHSRADIRSHGINREIEICGIPVSETFTNQDLTPRVRGGPRRAIFVGRIVREKGVLDLVQAITGEDWARSVEWHFAGDGPAADQVRQQMTDSHLPFRFHGHSTREQIAELLAASDFLVLPTYSETFGLAVTEALCMGLPVVATRGTACEEFVGPDDGFLVTIGDITSLRAGLKQMLASLESFDRASIAERARDRFGIKAVAARYAPWLRELAAR